MEADDCEGSFLSWVPQDLSPEVRAEPGEGAMGETADPQAGRWRERLAGQTLGEGVVQDTLEACLRHTLPQGLREGGGQPGCGCVQVCGVRRGVELQNLPEAGGGGWARVGGMFRRAGEGAGSRVVPGAQEDPGSGGTCPEIAKAPPSSHCSSSTWAGLEVREHPLQS